MLVKQLSSNFAISMDWRLPDQKLWVHGSVIGLLNPKCLASPFDLSQHKIPIILAEYGYLKSTGIQRPFPGFSATPSTPDSAGQEMSNAAMAEERQAKRRRKMAAGKATAEAPSSPSTGRERDLSQASSTSTAQAEPAETPCTPSAQLIVKGGAQVVRSTTQTRSSQKSQKNQQKP